MEWEGESDWVGIGWGFRGRKGEMSEQGGLVVHA